MPFPDFEFKKTIEGKNNIEQQTLAEVLHKEKELNNVKITTKAGSIIYSTDIQVVEGDTHLTTEPAGSNGEIQFNDNGEFSSSPSLTFELDESYNPAIVVDGIKSNKRYFTIENIEDTVNKITHSIYLVGHNFTSDVPMTYERSGGWLSLDGGDNSADSGADMSGGKIRLRGGESYGLAEGSGGDILLEPGSGTYKYKWKIPSNDDFTELKQYIIDNHGTDVGDILKDASASWDYGVPSWRSGWDALPEGRIDTAGGFSNVGSAGYWWTKTRNWVNSYGGQYGYILSSSSAFSQTHGLDGLGMSLRCFRRTLSTEQSDADGTVYASGYEGNDGTLYDTVKIGQQVWVNKNLEETKWSDGSVIPSTTSASAWAEAKTNVEPMRWGRLYNRSVLTGGAAANGIFNKRVVNSDLEVETFNSGEVKVTKSIRFTDKGSLMMDEDGFLNLPRMSGATASERNDSRDGSMYYRTDDDTVRIKIGGTWKSIDVT